jgi:hypothetical protein
VRSHTEYSRERSCGRRVLEPITPSIKKWNRALLLCSGESATNLEAFTFNYGPSCIQTLEDLQHFRVNQLKRRLAWQSIEDFSKDSSMSCFHNCLDIYIEEQESPRVDIDHLRNLPAASCFLRTYIQFSYEKATWWSYSPYRLLAVSNNTG